MYQLVKLSQEALERANERLEQVYRENRRLFREKEEQWEMEMTALRREMGGEEENEIERYLERQ